MPTNETEQEIRDYVQRVEEACKAFGTSSGVSDFRMLLDEIDKLRLILRGIIAHAGHPVAAEGCRIIIAKCKEALEIK